MTHSSARLPFGYTAQWQCIHDDGPLLYSSRSRDDVPT